MQLANAIAINRCEYQYIAQQFSFNHWKNHMNTKSSNCNFTASITRIKRLTRISRLHPLIGSFTLDKFAGDSVQEVGKQRKHAIHHGSA